MRWTTMTTKIKVEFSHEHIGEFIRYLKGYRVKHGPIQRLSYGYQTEIWGDTSFLLLQMTDTDLTTAHVSTGNLGQALTYNPG